MCLAGSWFRGVREAGCTLTVEHQSSSVDPPPPPFPNFRSILRSSRGTAAISMVKSRTAEQHRSAFIAGLHRCIRARNHKQQHHHVRSYFHFHGRNRSPALSCSLSLAFPFFSRPTFQLIGLRVLLQSSDGQEYRLNPPFGKNLQRALCASNKTPWQARATVAVQNRYSYELE